MRKLICKRIGNPSILSIILAYTYETKETTDLNALIKLALNSVSLDLSDITRLIKAIAKYRDICSKCY